jgi:hypothetical protein
LRELREEVGLATGVVGVGEIKVIARSGAIYGDNACVLVKKIQ